MKKCNGILAVACLLIAFGTCASAEVTWTLSDVTFNNGDQATGAFETDNAITTIDAFSITITGPYAFPVAVVDSAYLPSEIGIAGPGWVHYVDLYLTPFILTSAGGTVPISSGYDCPGCGTLNLPAQGHNPAVVGVVSPEPSAVFLLATVLGILGAAILRRRRVSVNR
jgi:hypothetical protein